MLISLREPKADIENRRQIKNEGVADRLYAIITRMRNIDEALDAAVTGDPDLFQDLQTSVEDLASMLDSKEMRISTVRQARLIPLCKKTLNIFDCATVDELLQIDTAKLQDDWGSAYGAFLAVDNARLENADALKSQLTKTEDNAADAQEVPSKVGPNGFVIASLPVVFTTDRSITKRMKEFPKDFHASQYAGGYSFKNQIIIGLQAENKGRAAIANKIAVVIGAYKAKGITLVNVLENSFLSDERDVSENDERSPEERKKTDIKVISKRVPYFWRRGNPLAFAWLMPISSYRRAPFSVRSVEINVKNDDLMVEDKPKNIEEQLVSNRESRELFEKFLANDSTYNALLEKAKVDKAFGDMVASRKSSAKAVARRNALLAQWREGSDAEALPDVADKNLVRVPEASGRNKYRRVSTHKTSERSRFP